MKIAIPLPGMNLGRVWAQALFYIPLLCLLASLATAPGQIYLGKLYYLKDIGVLLSFVCMAALAYSRGDRTAMAVALGAGVLMFPFIPVLLLRRDETPATSLTVLWIVKWAVAAQLGLLARRLGLRKAMVAGLVALGAILLVDAALGLWEIRTQGYFFDLSAQQDETAAGVVMVKQEHVEDLIRVLALHRSGGDFGNAMATGMILCAFGFSFVRKLWVRLALAPIFCLFAYDLFFSTVRSFLVGAVAGVAALMAFRLFPRASTRAAIPGVLAIIGLSVFFSYFNIIPAV